MEVRRMFRFAIQRVLETIPVLILMSMLVFGLVLLLPGDPVLGMLGPGAQVDEETIARLRADLRLNDPIPVQYVAWMENVLQGDFGRSVTTKQPVLDAFASRLPVSAFLAGYAIVLMILIAVPLGTIAAVKRGTAWDLIASGISVFGLAVPGFWLAILLVMLFSIKLDILPSSGYVSPFEDPVQSLKYMFLPALALGAAGSGSLTRQLRSSLLEVLQEDYVRTARAKGLRGNTVLFRHAMRNALIPSVTVLGLSLGDLLGGSLIIESIFLVPGMGSLLVNAIFTRDFPVVQAGTLIIAVGVVIVNLGVDVLYGLLDPRIG
jgi:peptide/nickel transport system permease protein